jgi:hypothetical protein
MIIILKTKTSLFPHALRPGVNQYRSLGSNNWGDWYHEFNTQMNPLVFQRVADTDPRVIDYAFDTNNNKYFHALYQEIKPVAFTK